MIYLKRCKVPKPHFTWRFPTGKTVHVFQFEVIKNAGMAGLLPLMVLAKGGKNRTVVEEAITAFKTVEDENTRDLLSLTYIFAALALVKEADRQWLKRRFGMFEDALKDSWAYQEILQEGELKGKEEGKLEERLVSLQLQRQVFDSLVQDRFPHIVELANERSNTIDKPEVLQALILRLFKVKTEEEARRILSH